MATTRVEHGRRLFTVAEYDRMAEAGILTAADRVELIEGEILVMSPIGHRHGSCAARLNELLVTRVGPRALVWIQSPLQTAPRSKPQPDLALLRRRSYAGTGPTEADTLLVVEVAETSLAYDRGVKRELYAAAGIPELWIVDVAGALVEVHRDPVGRTYRDVRRALRGESVAPAAFPDASLPVNDVFV